MSQNWGRSQPAGNYYAQSNPSPFHQNVQSPEFHIRPQRAASYHRQNNPSHFQQNVQSPEFHQQQAGGRPNSSNFQGSRQNYQQQAGGPPNSSNFQGSRQNYPAGGRPNSSNYHGSRQNYQNSNHDPYYQTNQFYTKKSASEIDADDQQYYSRQLSSILRHRAADMKLNMDSGGFVPIHQILRLANFRDANQDIIQKIVKDDQKQRFHMKLDEKTQHWFIRANQGHSIQLENLDLEEITDPSAYPLVLHGTYKESWSKIRAQGLKTMRRNHIHFAADMPGSSGVISGMRQTCDIIIYLDLEKAMKDGIKFYLSLNNVILSSGNEKNIIAPEYFQKAVDFCSGRHLSLTEPDQTSSTKTSYSDISERVTLREEGMKTCAKSKVPLGYNPTDDSPPKSKDRKKKKDKKRSNNYNVKDEKQDNAAEQQREHKGASQKQERDVVQPQQKTEKRKMSGSERTSSPVNPDENVKGSKEDIRGEKGKKLQKKQFKQETSNSEEKENPDTEEEDTVESESIAMTFQCFDTDLEEELLELDKIFIMVQAKIFAVGNGDKLVILDRNKEDHVKFLQKIMNSHNIIKLITPMSSQKMDVLDSKNFQKILDILVLYSVINEKQSNSDLKAVYEKTTGKPAKSPNDIVSSENSEVTIYNKKAALLVWQAFEIYKYYEERLTHKIKSNIFRLSLEALKNTMAKK